MKLDDELKDLSPRLLGLKRSAASGQGMQVPERYFDALEAQVFHQLDELGARKKPVPVVVEPVPFWMRLFKPQFALALGSVLLLLLAGWWFVTPSRLPSAAPVAEVTLTPEEAEAYVLENAGEFEPEAIAALLPEDEPETKPTELPVRKIQKPEDIDLHPEDIEHLLDEMSDEELEKLL